MIAFASLFLGLVFGSRPVELVVGEPVAAVELRLDGERVGVMRGAPWVLECDFGSEIAPHHLEAIAYDEQDRELGRVSQWLNLPQSQAVANLILEPHKPGEPRIARLTWESAAGAQPVALTVTLDGQALPPSALEDPRRIVLPAVDEEQFHLLSVEMQFEDQVSTRVDLTFGGAYAEAVRTEITAVALLVKEQRQRAPSVAAIQGSFLKNGTELRVLAIEKELAEIVLVVDRPFPHFVVPGSRYKAPKALALKGQERLRFVSTSPQHSQGVSTSFRLFPISSAYGPTRGDMYSLLTRLIRPREHEEPSPTAAVAVAGLAAYGSRRRRAVVLLPSSQSRDYGELTPVRVRRYLDRLGVPLFIWDPESRPTPHVAAWGEVLSVGTFEELATALTQVRDNLEGQWIVWLEGRHLPQHITLAPGVEDFVLLRSRQPAL